MKNNSENFKKHSQSSESIAPAPKTVAKIPKLLSWQTCSGLLLLVAGSLLLPAAPVSKEWQQKVSRISWVAYSPSQGNPKNGAEPTVDSIKDDLGVLRKAGFTGIVTYSEIGIVGRELPTLAEAAGFKGIILGLWNLADNEELAAAKEASSKKIVFGFCMGNEGFPKRYQLKDLEGAIKNVRDLTHKPVTTSEEFDDYSDEELLRAGDWVFPNAHPYFHHKLEAKEAVQWTEAAYEDMVRRSDRFVMFKEVGLPTAGEGQGKLSEQGQEQYYLELTKTPVRFVYFEAFDLLWKNNLPVEPHWGLFFSDRTPKRLGWRLMGKEPPVPTDSPALAVGDVFYIYLDADSPTNHFKPTGFMGDTGDVKISETCEDNPHSGTSCIRVVYEAKGKGPSVCDYAAPCKFSGVYWQEPPNNWGKEARLKGKGVDLSGYKCLSFWARADSECKIQFKVGGIDQAYGDSLVIPRTKIAKLGKDWRKFEIDLKGADLRHIIGGFCWGSDWEANPRGAIFYLDDIRFEAK